MLDTAARLLRLLALLQARPAWGGAQLAERLDVTGRTVRRDVERLRSLGYPVTATPGAGGGYRLGAGAALPPLLLDDDEAVAVAVGLRTAADGTVAGLAEASQRAVTKLEQVLPARLRHRVVALQTATVPLASVAPTVDPDALELLARACRDCERTRFGYRDREGRLSSRTVEPHRLVHTGRRWYLVARDVSQAAWRTFRVDRIDRPISTGWRFTPQDPPDAAAFVADAVTSAPYRHQARVRLHGSVRDVCERVPPTVGTVEAETQDTCLLTTGSNSLDAIAVHLAFLGLDFDVLEPPELVDHVAAVAARLTQASDRSTRDTRRRSVDGRDGAERPGPRA